ncbi:hypothetical protein MJH12_19970, partial [bacterium]|nr:hypothetical protein [bacterium]
MALDLEGQQEFELSSFLASFEKKCKIQKLEFLKNSVVDCLLPSSFFNYTVRSSDKKQNNYCYDSKSNRYYYLDVNLSKEIQNRINQVFSYSQMEIDYLGSSLICDLQEMLDLSQKDDHLYLYANLSHSSLYLFTIRKG